jgi:hypothetical protein
MGERVWRRWSEWGWGLELAGGMAQVMVVGYDLFFSASHGQGDRVGTNCSLHLSWSLNNLIIRYRIEGSIDVLRDFKFVD